MNKLTHKAILASAGSGKTFQLAHRYIRLLAEKDVDGGVVAPDRICAMTFTRKAAGEIFDAIAEYLRLAASDESGSAALTSERIGMPELKKEDYLKLLRRFIDDLHRSRIGTFDSFIIGIAKAFPVELGIPMSFQVMDSGGAAAKENRQRILDHILGGADSNDIGKTFLESFKQATYGHEEKTMDRVLDDFLTKLTSLYRLCPDGSRWGNENAIWPDGNPYAASVQCDGKAILTDVRKWIGEQDLSTARAETLYGKIWAATVELAEFTRASSANELLDDSIFRQMLVGRESMKSGDFAISYYRTPYVIPAEVSAKIADLIHNMLVIEYERMLLRTVGLFRLLSTYESVYQDVTRSIGSFSFTDIQYLLAGAGESGRHISREQGVDRLYIDYRMDCRLDHWLLDEFQDTSDLQWGVFENLVEEIVQAESGRSFFYVGDVKQAIYSWRGGNYELFHKILDKYNQSPEEKLIDDVSIQKTYRCSQPVIDVVNKVFADLPADFPAPAVEQWTGKAWKDHETVSPTKDTGYVALLEAPQSDDGEKPEEQRCQLVADLLSDMQPVKRGLKVGVLVRGNDFGKELVNVLSRECEGMSFVHEGESGVAENEVAELLLAMVKVAAHPGDEYAWKYVQMTPMAEVLEREGVTQFNISRKLLAEIQEEGFQAFVRKWGRLLGNVCELGEYGVDCLNAFESAAAEFDAMGTPSCGSFLRYIDSYTIREQPTSKAVRVMTIHQSKGLEFDVVVLPELQAKKNSDMTRLVSTQLICSGDRADPDWVLKAPKKVISENDSVLNAQLEAANAKHCYDSLCVLYVAMTRARHALYLVTSGFKKAPSTMHPSVFLKTQLTGEANPKAEPNVKLCDNDYIRLYEGGSGSDWYEKDWPVPAGTADDLQSAIDDSRASTLSADYAKRHDRVVCLRHREPSRLRAMTRPASTLFEAKSTDIMNFGSAIHELLEQVEWAEDADVDKIVKDWEPTSVYDADVTKDVVIQFRNCMESDAIRTSLSQPSTINHQPSTILPSVWREKRFDVVVDGEFVSGAFDRVVIIKDAKGVPVSAAIYDYKSSIGHIDEKVEGYAPQMNTYRDALSVILALDKSKISLNLIFTKQQTLRTL